MQSTHMIESIHTVKVLTGEKNCSFLKDEKIIILPSSVTRDLTQPGTTSSVFGEFTYQGKEVPGAWLSPRTSPALELPLSPKDPSPTASTATLFWWRRSIKVTLMLRQK